MRQLFCAYNYFVYFLFFIAGLPAYSQTPCSISFNGRIIDLDDGKELEGTFIIHSKDDQTQITNEHGSFKFTNLCFGNHQFIIRHVGCRDSIINIELKKNIKMTIKLPHSAIELNAIDVMDKQPDMIKTQTVNEITAKELEGTRGQSLGESLKLISGVTTLNSGSTISKPMIHGMQGYRVLILNNGIRQEGQQWGNEHAPEIDPFIAQKLSVIKGANAVRYGSDAMAGVILVEPSDLPDTAAVTGEVNLVGMSNGQTGVASGILQGYFDKIKGLNWRIQGTYKKGGTIKTPTYYLKNTGVEEMNFSYALGYHRKNWGIEGYYSQFNTKIGVFSGAHVGNLTDLKNAFNAQKPQDSLATFSYDIGRPYQDISHELAKGKFHFHIAPRWIANLQYAYQYNIRKEYDKHPPLNNALAMLNKPELDYRITSQSVDLVVEHLNIKSFRGQFGGSYMNQKNVYLGRFFVPNFINNTWGIFASERYVKQHIEIEAGVRFDKKNLRSFYYIGNQLVKPELNFSNTSWNVGAIIKPKTNLNFFVNVGSAWRAPAPNELYSNGIHQGIGSIERGDPNLKTEQVYNVTVTGIYKLKTTSIELSGYHNQFSNFIYLNPASQPELTIKGAYPVFNYKQANARISGIDAKIQTQLLNHLELTTKAMLLRAWNYSINDYLVYMPSDRYSIDGKIFTKISKTIPDIYIQAGYQFITKQWRAPKNTDFAPPPKGYGLMTAEIGSSFKFGKQQLNISLAATNLLNTIYRDYLDRFRYFADSQGQNFTLRIKVPLTIYDKK
jgi:iron complex outermembrane recepter protein